MAVVKEAEQAPVVFQRQKIYDIVTTTASRARDEVKRISPLFYDIQDSMETFIPVEKDN